jgi:hypothetical protein
MLLRGPRRERRWWARENPPPSCTVLSPFPETGMWSPGRSGPVGDAFARQTRPSACRPPNVVSSPVPNGVASGPSAPRKALARRLAEPELLACWSWFERGGTSPNQQAVDQVLSGPPCFEFFRSPLGNRKSLFLSRRPTERRRGRNGTRLTYPCAWFSSALSNCHAVGAHTPEPGYAVWIMWGLVGRLLSPTARNDRAVHEPLTHAQCSSATTQLHRFPRDGSRSNRSSDTRLNTRMQHSFVISA